MFLQNQVYNYLIVNVFPLEFYEVELSEDDKFLVLASDGVWEFISNEEVCIIDNVITPI